MTESSGVECWGKNASGQLGDGTTVDRSLPAPISAPLDVVAISGGGFHTCALLDTTKVACWGENGSGQLGDKTTTDRSTPVTVDGLEGVGSIAMGTDSSCAALADGAARCWGKNGSGQLGDGTTSNRTSPVKVVGLSDVVDIGAGFATTCAVLANRQVACWGSNVVERTGRRDSGHPAHHAGSRRRHRRGDPGRRGQRARVRVAVQLGHPVLGLQRLGADRGFVGGRRGHRRPAPTRVRGGQRRT